MVDKLSEITRSDPVSLPTSHGVGANNIDRFLAQCRPETPCLVIDLDIVRARFPSTLVLARRCLAWDCTEAALPMMLMACRSTH